MKKNFIILMSLVFLISCNNDKIHEIQNDETTNKVDLNYNIGNSSFADYGKTKSAKEYDINHAVMVLDDGIGNEQTYVSSEESNGDLTFDIPDGNYSVNSLDVYDSRDKKILYLDDDKPILDVGYHVTDFPKITLTPIVRGKYFDWEVSSYVNNDSGFPLLPWIAGSIEGVSRADVLDYKKEDGWELVHNNFMYEDGHIPAHKYLLFYNKYTGILRMWYYYTGQDSYQQFNYTIEHTANLSLCNFHGDFAKPLNYKTPRHSEFVAGDDNVQTGMELHPNEWCMLDYEIAYDETVAGIDLYDSDFIFTINGMNTDKVNLTGEQSGTISGNVVLSGNGGSLLNVGKLIFDSSKSVSNTINPLAGSSNTKNPADLVAKLGNKVTKGFENLTSNLGKSALDFGKNAALNLFNSLLHKGNGSNKPNVNLSLSMKIKLNGIISEKRPVFTTNLYIPGMKSKPGLEFLYDKPLGVFNISTTPKVKYQQTYYHKGTSDFRYFQYFSLDRSSFEFVINPEIQNKITVIEKKSELCFYDRYEGFTKLTPTPGIGYAHAGSQNKLIFRTEVRNPNGGVYVKIPYNMGHEYYTFAEGFVPPVATTSYGICWDGSGIPADYFKFYPKLKPDGRIVVKTILKFIINQTGEQVSIVKTYLPTFVDVQTMPMHF